MKGYLLNQRGSALILSIAIILIFTILGLSLITLSSSGLNKNELREDSIQAQKLSQMGLDFVTNELYHTLQNELDEKNGLPVRAYVAYLESTLDNYLCFNSHVPASNISFILEKIKTGIVSPNFNNVSSTTGKGEYCILAYQDSVLDNGKINTLKKDVNILSFGTADTKDAFLISKVEIGTDSVPDHLNYVVGTNITSKNPKDGEGNLFLHGGVEIKGDMKVEGNLITRDYAYGGGQWVDSVLPRMIPFAENTHANLVLYGNTYKLNSNVEYDSHLTNTTFNSSRYTLVKDKTGQPDVKGLFHSDYTPKIVKRTPVKTPINIKGEKNNYYYTKGSGGINKVVNSTTLSNQEFTNQKVFYTHQYTTKECTSWFFGCISYKETTHTNESADYILTGKNTFNSLSIPGNLTISSNNSSLTTKKDGNDKGGTLYVGKNLVIGNMSTNDLSDKPDISVNGSIYVDGDLIIQGAELFSNALIYVDGNVSLKYSSVKGLNLGNNQTGSLVIFATGNIDISNNSVDTDPDDPHGPSIITGFFYSEKNFEMYGVGSNMIINGGISANRIVLNGIRGRSSVGKRNNELKAYSGNYYWEKAENQNSRSSRLRIHYNPDIITTFSDLRQQEQIITYIDPSRIIDLEFK